MNPRYDFTGQVALVTGGSSGMGLATAQAFAEAGAAVVLADVNEDTLRSATDDLTGAGNQALGVLCDVSSEDQVAAMVDQTVATFGRLDMAFNNAGIQAPPTDAADEPAETFDRVNAINLRGVWACMKHELRQMRSQGSGAIVNCSSLAIRNRAMQHKQSISRDGGDHARTAGPPCAAGEQWDQAMTYCRQAGEQALARSAYREAVAAFEQALEAVQHLPESRETLCRPSISASSCVMRSGPWASSGGLRQLTGCRSPRRTLGDHIVWGGSRPICWPILYRYVTWTAPSSLASAPWRLPRPWGCGPHGRGAGLSGACLSLPGGLSPGDGVLPQECGVSPRRTAPGAFRPAWTLPSVLARSFLVLSLAECGAFAEGQSSRRGRGADGRGRRSSL